MATLTDNPKLGHITTFGGNPVIASACLATLQEIIGTSLIPETLKKEKLIRRLLRHKQITEIRGKGLMLALIMESAAITDYLILSAAEKNLILFWLLFEQKAVRISPPLTISIKEIEIGCQTIIDLLNEYEQ